MRVLCQLSFGLATDAASGSPKKKRKKKRGGKGKVRKKDAAYTPGRRAFVRLSIVKFQLITIFSSYRESKGSGKGSERTVGSFAFLTVERVINMAAAFAWEGAFVSAVGGVGARGPAAPQARRPAVDFWSRRWPWLRRYKAPRRRRSRREGPARDGYYER